MLDLVHALPLPGAARLAGDDRGADRLQPDLSPGRGDHRPGLDQTLLALRPARPRAGSASGSRRSAAARRRRLRRHPRLAALRRPDDHGRRHGPGRALPLHPRDPGAARAARARGGRRGRGARDRARQAPAPALLPACSSRATCCSRTVAFDVVALRSSSSSTRSGSSIQRSGASQATVASVVFSV
ncbi:MAG: hypothetical protein MZU95_13485 [Desulfomicrobium escambiense]|nr:hypothetical protein [Desulfomicrobium escambiense]